MNLADLSGTSKTGWHTDNPRQPADITGLIPCDPERKKMRLPDENAGERKPDPVEEKTPDIPETADIPPTPREEPDTPASEEQAPDSSKQEPPQNSPDSSPEAAETESNDISQETPEKAVEGESDDISKGAGEHEEEKTPDSPETAEIPPASREGPDAPPADDSLPDTPNHETSENASDSPSTPSSDPPGNVSPEKSENSSSGESVRILKVSDDELRRIINGTRNDVVLLCSSAKEIEGLQRRHEIHLSLQRAALKKGLTDLSEQLSLIETALDGSAPTETGGTENAYGAVLRKVKQLPTDLDKGIAAVLGNAQNQVNLYCRQYLSVHKKKEPGLLSRLLPFFGAFFGSLVAMLILGKYLL